MEGKSLQLGSRGGGGVVLLFHWCRGRLLVGAGERRRLLARRHGASGRLLAARVEQRAVVESGLDDVVRLSLGLLLHFLEKLVGLFGQLAFGTKRVVLLTENGDTNTNGHGEPRAPASDKRKETGRQRVKVVWVRRPFASTYS